MKIVNLIIACACSVLVQAQPDTEIYLFEFTENGIANPINISNNPGYDNQPFFWYDSRSILYARTINGQTDIVRYHISTGETDIITKTRQGSEFSPTQIPGTDNISSIRLDTTRLQLLYSYDLRGRHKVLVNDLKIGYHTWLSPHSIVAFVLGDTITMQQIDFKETDGELAVISTKTIGLNIGRSLHRIQGTQSFSYVDKTVEPWTINGMDLISGEVRVIANTLGQNEDFCWTAFGDLLMGNENKLYLFQEGSSNWEQILNLNDFGIAGKISRLARSHDGKWLAIVVGQ